LEREDSEHPIDYSSNEEKLALKLSYDVNDLILCWSDGGHVKFTQKPPHPQDFTNRIRHGPIFSFLRGIGNYWTVFCSGNRSSPSRSSINLSLEREVIGHILTNSGGDWQHPMRLSRIHDVIDQDVDALCLMAYRGFLSLQTDCILLPSLPGSSCNSLIKSHAKKQSITSVGEICNYAFYSDGQECALSLSFANRSEGALMERCCVWSNDGGRLTSKPSSRAGLLLYRFHVFCFRATLSRLAVLVLESDRNQEEGLLVSSKKWHAAAHLQPWS
ncbi:hypothetical protein Tco_0815586, partial [Tanacetum coccineum]